MSKATNWLLAGCVLSLLVILNLGIRLHHANENVNDFRVCLEQAHTENIRVRNNARVETDILQRSVVRYVKILVIMRDKMEADGMTREELEDFILGKLGETQRKAPASKPKAKQPAKDKG